MSMPEIEGLRVERELGRGGFATVYQAWDTTFDRWVAAKVLTSPFTTDQQRRQFDRECRSLGRLSDHPGIITVLRAAETDGGHACLVMAFAEGGTWDDLLKAGHTMDEATVLQHGITLADALGAAHERQVLHLDIKPANVLVHHGRPMLGDFGIAKMTDATSAVTSGTRMLTAQYAPPELFDDRPPTPAADVWSLAATICAMVAGEPPFGGGDATMLALMAAIATGEPKDMAAHGLSPVVWQVLRACFAKDPGDRPADGAALREALQAALASPGLATPAPPPPDPSTLGERTVVVPSGPASGPPAGPPAGPPSGPPTGPPTGAPAASNSSMTT